MKNEEIQNGTNGSREQKREWDSADKNCWQESRNILPRLRIVTELKEYLITWVHIALVESDSSHRIITLHTTLGISFTIAAAVPQEELFDMLQIEHVKNIYPSNGVSVKTAVQP